MLTSFRTFTAQLNALIGVARALDQRLVCGYLMHAAVQIARAGRLPRVEAQKLLNQLIAHEYGDHHVMVALDGIVQDPARGSHGEH